MVRNHKGLNTVGQNFGTGPKRNPQSGWQEVQGSGSQLASKFSMTNVYFRINWIDIFKVLGEEGFQTWNLRHSQDSSRRAKEGCFRQSRTQRSPASPLRL